MTQYVGDYDASQGSLSFPALQNLIDKLTPTVIKSIERVCKTVVSGSAGVEADIPMGAEIIDVTSICLKSNGSGSMTVKTNADTPVAISNALQAATVDEVARAATIDTTYSIVGVDGISIFGNGAADYAAVYIKYLL